MMSFLQVISGTNVGALPASGRSLALSSPRPNPLVGRGGSLLEFRIQGPETLTFELFDVAGRRVAVRDSETFVTPGTHTVRWDPGLLGSGVYYLRLGSASGEAVGTRWTMLR